VAQRPRRPDPLGTHPTPVHGYTRDEADVTADRDLRGGAGSTGVAVVGLAAALVDRRLRGVERVDELFGKQCLFAEQVEERLGVDEHVRQKSVAATADRDHALSVAIVTVDG